jgi:anaerobic magnesium-protoporphyrin IX monomethyl ester cyclase
VPLGSHTRPRRVLLIYNSNEHIGMTYLSAALKARGHEVRLAYDPQVFRGEPLVRVPYLVDKLDLTGRIIDLAVDWSPDLVGFGCYTDNFRWMLELAEGIKSGAPHIPLAFGGVHVTSVPETVAEYAPVDALVLGEADEAFVEFVEAIETGPKGAAPRLPTDIRNTWVRDEHGEWVRNPIRPYIVDLDTLPLRDFDLFFNKVPPMEENYLCMASRGCPYACSYCAVEMYHRSYAAIGDKTRFRRRGIDGVIEELKIIKRRGRVKTISFMDDVFTGDRKWLDPFLARYKAEIGLPFWCYTYPSGLSAELVKLLADAGCWMMTMGVQSGSRSVRREMMNRREKDDYIFRTARVIQEAGILLSVDKIVGSPGETSADRERDVDMFRSLAPDRILTFPLTYFPGTDMVRKGLEAGELTPEDAHAISHGRLEQQPALGRLKAEPVKYRKLLIQMGLIPFAGSYEPALEPLVNGLARIPGSEILQPLLLAANAIRIGDHKFNYLLKVAFGARNVP